MKLHNLNKTVTSKAKRKGRGYGSGAGGHTSTRGQKGQKTRTTLPLWFEGGQLPLSRRLPFLKGKGRFVSLNPRTVTIGLDQLETNYKSKEVVSTESLVSKGLISLKEAALNPVKITGKGNLTKNLSVVGLELTTKAKEVIVKLGGAVDSGN